MRVVGLPADAVDADAVADDDTGWVVDEADDDALAEDVAREPATERLAQS